MANPLLTFLASVRADYETNQRYRAKYHGDGQGLACAAGLAKDQGACGYGKRDRHDQDKESAHLVVVPR